MSTATKVREKPILFSAPMVRAILDGRKFQTRRVIKPQPERQPTPCHWSGTGWALEGETANQYGKGCSCIPVKCPWMVDQLWVRETWTPDHAAFYPNFPIVYRADFGPEYERNERGEVYSPEQKSWYPFRWRPSIHMPRRASRLTLEITDVRVERLQSISEGDAHMEGVEASKTVVMNDGTPCYSLPFQNLWHSIHGIGEHSWESNPWVWAVSFKRVP